MDRFLFYITILFRRFAQNGAEVLDQLDGVQTSLLVNLA